MTTIALRYGSLAADTSTYIHEGNLRMPFDGSQKIHRLSDNSLVAGSGIKRQIADFVLWCENGEQQERPSIDEATIIRVWPNGKASIFDGKSDERDISSCEFYAIGSGAGIALGALAMGATAEQAVEIASRFNPWTGGQIQVEHVTEHVIAPVARCA